jgi:hypothetical protein
MKEGAPRPESSETFGRNVHLRSRYFRHAEKASGNVGAGQTFSSANISPRGAEESKILGRQLGEPLTKGIKLYGSSQDRTIETGEATASGLREGSEPVPELSSRRRQELLFSEPEEYAGPYLERWETNKRAIMIDRGIIGESADAKTMKIAYDALDTTTQADIAESAEEPVISEWLDDPNSELAQAYLPEHAATEVAILVHRDLKAANRLPNDSAYDMMKVTHKTVTEALLKRIIQLEGGKKPERLADIGGSLGLNDGFEFDIQTDEHGERVVTFTMYRVDRSGEEPKYVTEKYDVDLRELERLAELGVKLRKEKREG